MYAKAIHSATPAEQAREALNLTEYAIDENGRRAISSSTLR
jgi:hypothetical protein